MKMPFYFSLLLIKIRNNKGIIIHKILAKGETKYSKELAEIYFKTCFSEIKEVIILTNSPASKKLKTTTCQIANPDPERCISKRLLSTNVRKITRIKNIEIGINFPSSIISL